MLSCVHDRSVKRDVAVLTASSLAFSMETFLSPATVDKTNLASSSGSVKITHMYLVDTYKL